MTAAPVPAPDPHADPREFRWIRAGDLVIDDRTQRRVDAGKVSRIATGFDWARFETLTVARTGNPTVFDVIEGQHRRGGALMYGGPDLLLPCMVLPAPDLTGQQQSGIALGIVKGRAGHTRFEQWKLALNSGSPREVAADTVLTQRHLKVGPSTAASTIGAVATVGAIMKYRVEPEDAATLLAATLDVIQEAFPDADSALARWDRSILLAVAKLLRVHPQADVTRVMRSLKVRPAVQWVSIGRGDATATPPTLVYEKLISEYNRHLKAANRLKK